MKNANKLRLWAAFIENIRTFFNSRGFLEVSTPILVSQGAIEASIDTLSVTPSSPPLELHTSPEFEMKRLIAETHLSLFQICKCFRNDPPTPIHTREFTMLEFYQVGGTLHTVKELMKNLMDTVNQAPLHFSEFTVAELFEREIGIKFDELLCESKFKNYLTQTHVLHYSENDGWEDLFFKLMIEKIEPSLDPTSPTLITNYPAPLAALAEIEGSIAKKFEIYWWEMELCNGCIELTDAEALPKRYEAETRRRLQHGRKPHPFPEALSQALKKGIPQCAGVAVGLDRLFRALQIEKFKPLGEFQRV